MTWFQVSAGCPLCIFIVLLRFVLNVRSPADG